MRVIGSVALHDIDAAFAAQLLKVKGAVDEALRDTAVQVRDVAKRTAAFTDRTGHLRRSIRMKKSKFEDGGYIVTATGRNRNKDLKGYHAWLVEHGHVKVLWGRRTSDKVPPHPFLDPALKTGRAYLSAKIAAMGGSK